MNCVVRNVATIGLLLAAGPAWGQDDKPAADDRPAEGRAYRLEIWNGPSRTVQYVSRGGSPGEMSSLRDLARAENEADYADQLQAMRRMYVTGERLLEARRQRVQPSLYGIALDREGSEAVLAGSYGGGYYPYGTPGFYGNGYGYAYAGSSLRVHESIAAGIGPEGRIKEEMAKLIVRQATPEYTAAVASQLRNATAAATPRDGKKPGDIVLAGPGSLVGHEVSITMKGSDKPLDGKLVAEDETWTTVKTATEVIRVRSSEVNILRAKSQ